MYISEARLGQQRSWVFFFCLRGDAERRVGAHPIRHAVFRHIRAYALKIARHPRVPPGLDGLSDARTLRGEIPGGARPGVLVREDEGADGIQLVVAHAARRARRRDRAQFGREGWDGSRVE